MFKEEFKFHTGYTIPRSKKIEDIRKHIEAMPQTDSPEAFGLHPNADITSVQPPLQPLLQPLYSPEASEPLAKVQLTSS